MNKLVHPDNRAFLEKQSRHLTQVGEILFNLNRKKRYDSAVLDSQNRRAKIIVITIVSVVVIVPALSIFLYLLDDLITHLNSEAPNSTETLVTVCLLIPEVIALIIGMDALRKLWMLIRPNFVHIYLIYRSLVRKGSLTDGIVIGIKGVDMDYQSESRKMTEIKYRFTDKHGTQIVGNYYALKNDAIEIDDKVAVLYLNTSDHILI